MRYKLGRRSLGNLAGVHPHLVAVVMLAITESTQDFSVREGTRTLERQKQLVGIGASWTLDSDHIPRVSTEPHAVGHAVDLYPYVRDDPRGWLDPHRLEAVIVAMLKAAERLNVQVYSGAREWGHDMFHFGLVRSAYPTTG